MTNTKTEEPHPLGQFGLNGDFRENTYADVILTFLRDWQCEEPDSIAHKAATWFLFESELAFYFACSECGIDGEAFRKHLLKCQAEETAAD